MAVLTLALCARLSWLLVSSSVHIKSLHIIIIIVIIISRRLFRFVKVHAFDRQTDTQTDVDGKRVRCLLKVTISCSSIFFLRLIWLYSFVHSVQNSNWCIAMQQGYICCPRWLPWGISNRPTCCPRGSTCSRTGRCVQTTILRPTPSETTCQQCG